MRLVHSDRRVSLSQGWEWEDRVGLMDRGQEDRDCPDSVAALTSREENVLEATTEEKRVATGCGGRKP